jgi:hypothetical protein
LQGAAVIQTLILHISISAIGGGAAVGLKSLTCKRER